MTFPIIEIYCPECKKLMTLVNKPKLMDYKIFGFTTSGYDEVVDYNYQCKSKERYPDLWEDYINGKKLNYNAYTDKEIEKLKNSGWCNISKHNHILVMRILIPDLKPNTVAIKGNKLDGYGQWNVNLSKGEKPPKCEFYNIKYCPPCPEHYYDCDLVKIGNQIKIDKWKPILTFKEFKKKIKLFKKKFGSGDITPMFMKAGQAIFDKGDWSIKDIYDIMKGVIELINPEKDNLSEKEIFNTLNDKFIIFINDCIDEILNEEI